MGAVGNDQRIWSRAFDVDLCVNEAVLENNRAHIPLYLYLPSAGRSYTLKLESTPRDREQLWLCRNGQPFVNLTALPEYTLEGIGGTTEEYSLSILSGITATEAVTPPTVYAYAENGRIVITGLAPGDDYAIYDLAGRLYAKGKSTGYAQVKTEAPKGACAVKAGGRSFVVIN
jgi:hypothetical protein